MEIERLRNRDCEEVLTPLSSGTEPTVKLCEGKDLHGLLVAIGKHLVKCKVKREYGLKTLELFHTLLSAKSIERLGDTIRYLTSSVTHLHPTPETKPRDNHRRYIRNVQAPFKQQIAEMNKSDRELVGEDVKRYTNDLAALLLESTRGGEIYTMLETARERGDLSQALLADCPPMDYAEDEDVDDAIAGVIAAYDEPFDVEVEDLETFDVWHRKERSVITYILCKHFGKGILLLHSLNRDSPCAAVPRSSVVVEACQAAVEHCPELRSMFAALHSCVMDPIMSGGKPTINLNITSDDFDYKYPLKFLLEPQDTR